MWRRRYTALVTITHGKVFSTGDVRSGSLYSPMQEVFERRGNALRQLQLPVLDGYSMDDLGGVHA